MNILSIETSCDETGIALVEHTKKDNKIILLGNALASQIELHAQYGGVFPIMAKRAHAEKILPLIKEVLSQAQLLKITPSTTGTDSRTELIDLLVKESELLEPMILFFDTYIKPDIDYIAITVGPGLEPALWVGVNVAKVLSIIWDIPVIPINHMEGHIVTAAIEEVSNEARDLNDFSGPPVVNGLNQIQKNPPFSSFHKTYRFKKLKFPALALLVSGGHTELVMVESFGSYKKIGQTRDDAVGEAFDKVARMIGLPYPGGPAISTLAAQFRIKQVKDNTQNIFSLPRPMMHSPDYDFSFSGIKTAVLYTIRDFKLSHNRELDKNEKEMLATAFEDAVVEVLIKKTLKAAEQYHATTIIVGGGVASNIYLREQFTKAFPPKHGLGGNANTTVLFPEPWLATDNAVMIGMVAMVQIIHMTICTMPAKEIRADGNLSITNK